MEPPDAPTSLAQVAAAAPERRPASARPVVDRVAGGAAVLVLLGLAGWVTFGSLQQDLAAYVVAGRARALDLDPYVNHLLEPGGPWDGLATYRHSRFLYPPLLADLFRPLGALPYVWAKGVFSFASVGALALGLWIARRGWVAGSATKAKEPRGSCPRHERGLGAGPRLGPALLVAALWPPVFIALERGQIDLFLLPLLAFAWWRRHDRPILAGLALALAALAKPFLLLGWPLLLCARQVRVVAAAGAALAILMAVGAGIAGPALSRRYLSEVLPRAMLYGEGGPADWLLPDDDLARAGAFAEDEGHVRVDPAGRSFPAELGRFRRNASLVRALAGDEDPSRLGAGVVLLILGTLLARAAARRPEHPGWYWAAPLGGMAAAPVAWAMSLLLGLPLLFAACRRGREPAQRRVNLALGAAWATGVIGPLIPAASALAPWAWPLVALAGVAAGAFAATGPRSEA